MTSSEINLETDINIIEAVDNFWGNDVIWREITSYLNTTDLKEFSQANQYFLQRIRSLHRFALLAGQVVTGEMKIHTFKLSRAIVEVNKIEDNNVLQELAPKTFQDTEYLELLKLGKLTEEDRNSRLIDIVSNCTKLKSLTLGEKSFMGKNYQSFFKDTNVKSILSNLKELEIGLSSKEYKEYEKSEVWEAEDVEYYEEWSLESLSQVRPENHIYPIETFKLFPDLKLKLEKFCYIAYKEIENSHFHPGLILSTSQKTLTELTLRIRINGLEGLNSMQFPKLSKVTLELYRSDTDPLSGHNLAYTEIFSRQVIPFLRNHLSTLTELVLYSHGEFSLAPFCEVLKSSKKIKLLNFRGHRSFTRSVPSVNWDFISGLSTLRYFKISMHDKEYISNSDDESTTSSDEEDEAENLIEDERRARNPNPSRSDSWNIYFQALPSNVKFIGFRGFNFNGRPEDLTSVVTSQLIRFKNLTVLSMIDCPVFFNDEIMQFICQHMTNLRVLKGDFRYVTDFGITGCRDDGYDSGFSLKNLTGMTKLVMHSSDDEKSLITWKGLLQSIHFLDLVKLTITADIKDAYYGNSKKKKSENKSHFLKLIGQNPSLERIWLAFFKPPANLQDKIHKENSRIKVQPVGRSHLIESKVGAVCRSIFT